MCIRDRVKGALDPNEVAICIGERLLKYHRNDEIIARLARLKEFQRIAAETRDVAQRVPYFCSGCPHNSSTVVPEGMRAYAAVSYTHLDVYKRQAIKNSGRIDHPNAAIIGVPPGSLPVVRPPTPEIKS